MEDKPVIRRRVTVDLSKQGVPLTSAMFDASGLSTEEWNKQCLDFFDWVNSNWKPPIYLGSAPDMCGPLLP